jgi:hypothetical protein
VLEEALHEVLGVLRTVPAMPGEGVQRRPVALAEPSKRLGSAWGAALGRFQYDAPTRRLKPRMAERCRAVVLVHGPKRKSTQVFHKAAELQRRAKRAWDYETLSARSLCNH